MYEERNKGNSVAEYTNQFPGFLWCLQWHNNMYAAW